MIIFEYYILSPHLEQHNDKAAMTSDDLGNRPFSWRGLLESGKSDLPSTGPQRGSFRAERPHSLRSSADTKIGLPYGSWKDCDRLAPLTRYPRLMDACSPALSLLAMIAMEETLGHCDCRILTSEPLLAKPLPSDLETTDLWRQLADEHI